MKNPIKRSDLYVCGNPRGFDEFTPVAVVLEKTDKSVTYERYIEHGCLKFEKRVMISAEDFENYYHPINDVEYAVLKVLGYMQLTEDYDDDSFWEG